MGGNTLGIYLTFIQFDEQFIKSIFKEFLFVFLHHQLNNV
jgi:hypothetical protein